MHLHPIIVASVLAAGCYSGPRAAKDVNAAWRGHARAELEARLGAPQVVQQPDGQSSLRWSRRGHDVALPNGRFDLQVTNASVELHAEVQPGVVAAYAYDVATAVTDRAGVVLQFDSGVIAAGIPNGTNLRTGMLLGFGAGVGGVVDASSPMPSLSTYIGGMIGPRLGLVGVYQFVNGRGADGAAMGHAWGIAVQHWATERLSVRAGAAMALDLEPGLHSPGIAPGGIAALSYAFVRSGSFVLDARFDATIATSTAFGMFGLGVNIN